MLILNLDDYRDGIEELETDSQEPDLQIEPLIARCKGKTPFQVARLFAQEYAERFPEADIVQLDLSMSDPMGLRRNSWRLLREACRQNARAYMHCMERGEYHFWDELRWQVNMIQCSSSNIYRKVEKARKYHEKSKAKAIELNDESQHWFDHPDTPIVGIGICQYCWRFVPYRLGENAFKLRCFKHREKNYEQRKRAKLRKLGAEMGFLPPIGAEIEIPDGLREMPFRGGLEYIYPYIPNVRRHLVKTGLKFRRTRDLIIALEGEAPQNEPHDILTKRNLFYLDCDYEPIWYRPNFLWAEAWLKFEATLKDNRGGKRPGAGRPRKNK